MISMTHSTSGRDEGESCSCILLMADRCAWFTSRSYLVEVWTSEWLNVSCPCLSTHRYFNCLITSCQLHFPSLSRAGLALIKQASFQTINGQWASTHFKSTALHPSSLICAKASSGPLKSSVNLQAKAFWASMSVRSLWLRGEQV